MESLFKNRVVQSQQCVYIQGIQFCHPYILVRLVSAYLEIFGYLPVGEAQFL